MIKMKKGITKLLISLAAALLTVVPFSFKIYADVEDYNYIGYEIPSYSMSAYNYFQSRNLNLTYILDREVLSDPQYYTCTVWDSQGRGCQQYTRVQGGVNAPSTEEVYQYALFGYMQGQYRSQTSNLWRYAGYLSANQTQYLIFYTRYGVNEFNHEPTVEFLNPDAGQNITSQISYNVVNSLNSGFDLHIISWTSNGYTGPFQLNLPNYNNVTGYIRPLYYGIADRMPDNVYREVFGSDRGLTVYDENLNRLTDTGNNASQSSVSSSDQQNQQLNTSITNLTQQEDDFLDDMDDSLNDITWSSSLLGNSSLALSANWVKTQYERMTQNNVLGDIIQYAMLFGLGLLIVGKMR